MMNLPMPPTAPIWMLAGDFEAAARIAGEIVCRAYGVSFDELKTHRGPRRITWARQVRDWLVVGNRLMTGIEFERHIGRNHATAAASLRAVRNAREAYPSIRQETDRLAAQFAQLLAPRTIAKRQS